MLIDARLFLPLPDHRIFNMAVEFRKIRSNKRQTLYNLLKVSDSICSTRVKILELCILPIEQIFVFPTVLIVNCELVLKHL
jgi:hypothetical protein